MEINTEKVINLCSRMQGLSIELYKMTNQQTSLDQFMLYGIRKTSVQLYASAANIVELEGEKDIFRDVAKYGSLRSMLLDINAQLLMCFQLGMLNSDICIDFGYQMEQLKNEIQTHYDLAKDEFDKNNPFGNFDEDEE